MQSFTVCSGVPGNTQIVRELETNIARFVGKEDAVVFGMGFATNSTNMRCLVSKVGGHIWGTCHLVCACHTSIHMRT